MQESFHIMSTIERKKWSSQGGLIALAVVALLGLSSPVARAESFTLTASGTSSGGNTVDATATVTITAGVIQISITDLLVNPTSDGQTINGIQFVLSSGQTTGTLASSSALHRLVTGNGVGDYSDSGPSSTTWNLNGNVSGGIELTSIGNMGGSPTIIGDPNAGNAYSSANGSIKNNHNFRHFSLIPTKSCPS
jgi:hypothetical protein